MLVSREAILLLRHVTESDLESILRNVDAALRIYQLNKVPLTPAESITHNALLMVRDDILNQIVKARFDTKTGKN